MGVEPSECLVVEDGSSGGLKAAMGAGMRCVVTYTPATKWKVRRMHGKRMRAHVHRPIAHAHICTRTCARS